MKHLIALLLALTQPHTAMTKLSQYCGDSRTHAIPLLWEGAAFSPGTDWNLIWTAKKSANDDDTHAVIQKASGAGITVTGSTAYVELVPQDTAAMASGDIVWDIQAQNNATGAVRTLADGRLTLIRDVTRLTRTSIPIYTANPYPFTINSSQIGDAVSSIFEDTLLSGRVPAYDVNGALYARSVKFGSSGSTAESGYKWASIDDLSINYVMGRDEGGYNVMQISFPTEMTESVSIDIPTRSGVLASLPPFASAADAVTTGGLLPYDSFWNTTRNRACVVPPSP